MYVLISPSTSIFPFNDLSFNCAFSRGQIVAFTYSNHELKFALFHSLHEISKLFGV
jgi:hypothetical protein